MTMIMSMMIMSSLSIYRREHDSQKSCYNNENIINSIVSRTEPYSTNIKTIILIFCKDNSRNYIDHKSKKTNDSHSLTVRYPPDGILVDNPKKDDNTSDNHNPPFYLSEKCFYSIGFIQSIYTTKIICPIKNKV